MNETEHNVLIDKFKKSAACFADLRVIVFCGVMGALSVVLNQFSVRVTDFLTITTAWIPNRMVDCLFGPFTGMVYGGVMDIVKYIIRPSGPFNFFFTLVPMVAALITGTIMFRSKWTLRRIILVQFLVKLICNVIMTTWALSFFYGKSIVAILPARALKNAVECGVDAVIMFVILTAFESRIYPLMRNAGWPVFIPVKQTADKPPAV